MDRIAQGCHEPLHEMEPVDRTPRGYGDEPFPQVRAAILHHLRGFHVNGVVGPLVLHREHDAFHDLRDGVELHRLPATHYYIVKGIFKRRT